MGATSTSPNSSGADLIGRDHPAGVLRAEVERNATSHGGLALVTGEAGVGKTALVTMAVEEARRQGALVLSGSCWSENAPGYWPWTQALRGLRRVATSEEWAAAEEAAAGNLAVLFGESPSTDPTESFQLYDAVTTALVAVSHLRPVVVVLEDLHWADTASLKLLEFAAQHTWFERLLLVGTYRDVEIDPGDHPLEPLLAPLAAKATTVTLTGLGQEEVAALMARIAGHTPETELVTEVLRRTGGNPFFVEQTTRLLHSGGSVTTVAPGVRAALRRRVSLLPAGVADLLTVAATLGHEFHRDVLAATADPAVPVGRLLDTAVTARLVVALEGGRFAFAHDLVRDTLYDALGDDVARRCHAAVVRALDRTPQLRAHLLAAEVAQHAHLAGTELDPAHVVDLLVAAAEDAESRLAREESIRHRRRALEWGATLDARRRVVLALDLFETLRHHEGDRDGSWVAFDTALTVARESGDPRLLARVALSLLGCSAPGDRRRLHGELITEALRGLSPQAAADPETVPIDRLERELIVHTVGAAQRDYDDEALTFGLMTLHDSKWGLGTADERATLTVEIREVARRTGNVMLEHLARGLEWVALLEQGDPAYFERYTTLRTMFTRKPYPLSDFFSSVDQSVITAFLGRFTEARAHLRRGRELTDSRDAVPERAEHPEHLHFFILKHIHWSHLLLQGAFADLDRLHQSPHHPHADLLAAITAVERGDTEAALRHVRKRVDTTEPYPPTFAPLWLRLLAQVAAATRDRELCDRARGELAPYAGQWLVAAYGCEISGPVQLWLGLLDAAQERWEQAVEHLTGAWHSADRMGARPWSVRARTHLAETLLARDAAAEATTATELLAEVEHEARELGMANIAERVDTARAAMDTVKTDRTRDAPTEPEDPGSDTPEFRWEGMVWSLGFAGRTAHLPDTKGLRDLHLLLSQPETDIPAVRLLSPEGGEAVVAARRLGGDAVLDDEAKASYRNRLTELDEEIERATSLGNDHRAVELDRERAALLEELRTTAGLAGNSRRLGDEAERARKAVTARIRTTLGKLEAQHPELAAHLRATVSTGASCAYRPRNPVPWSL